MFLISKPSEDDLDGYLTSVKDADFSYSEIGATRGSSELRGYTIDHNRQLLGSGEEVFDRAKEALRGWHPFSMPWVRLFRRDTPLVVGNVVAIAVEHFGFHSLNSARIVYAIDDDQAADTRQYGFAYGTLTEHGEIGEERFSVEMLSSGEVWYDLYAFSRPGALLAKLGYPLGRYLQKRFAADSKAAMLAAVTS